MRRVMVLAWGAEASAYAGRKLTLYRNPEITFGKDKVGGIEISHLSHLDKPLTVALTATRGRRKAFAVTPLIEAAPRDFMAEAEQANGDVDLLKALWTAAQRAGQPAEILDTIRAMATPRADEPAS
jgi:hypothetical protein